MKKRGKKENLKFRQEKAQKRYKPNRFFKKKTFVIFLAMMLLFLAMYILSETFSLFETNTTSKADLDIAFYCIEEDYQTMNLKLEQLEPRDNPYIYDFGIYNNKSGKRTETNLEYDLNIRTTTNLPLSYKIYYAGRNITPTNNSQYIDITNSKIYQDEDGTYFMKINVDKKEFTFTEDQFDLYRIEIIFPKEYNEYKNQDIIDILEININSKQKI